MNIRTEPDEKLSPADNLSDIKSYTKLKNKFQIFSTQLSNIRSTAMANHVGQTKDKWHVVLQKASDAADAQWKAYWDLTDDVPMDTYMNVVKKAMSHWDEPTTAIEAPKKSIFAKTIGNITSWFTRTFQPTGDVNLCSKDIIRYSSNTTAKAPGNLSQIRSIARANSYRRVNEIVGQQDYYIGTVPMATYVGVIKKAMKNWDEPKTTIEAHKESFVSNIMSWLKSAYSRVVSRIS